MFASEKYNSFADSNKEFFNNNKRVRKNDELVNLSSYFCKVSN